MGARMKIEFFIQVPSPPSPEHGEQSLASENLNEHILLFFRAAAGLAAVQRGLGKGHY